MCLPVLPSFPFNERGGTGTGTTIDDTALLIFYLATRAIFVEVFSLFTLVCAPSDL